MCQLSRSLEDYLEAVYWTVSEKGAARPRDVARRLGVSGASVTSALRTLARKGLVNYAPYEVVTLTRRGAQRARQVALRHRVLRDFLVDVLGVDEHTADDAACRMEHALPAAALERLVRHVREQKKSRRRSR